MARKSPRSASALGLIVLTYSTHFPKGRESTQSTESQSPRSGKLGIGGESKLMIPRERSTSILWSDWRNRRSNLMNQAEENWIREQLQQAERFVERYSPNDNEAWAARLYCFLAHRAAARQEQCADHHGADAGAEYSPVRLGKESAQTQSATHAPDISPK